MRFELFIQTWRFTFALEGFSEAIWVSGKEMKIMNQSQPFTNEILSESLIWSWQQQRKGPLVMVTLAVWVFAGGLLRSGTQGAWHSWKVWQSRDGILETEFICLRVQVPEKNLLHKSTMFSVDSHSWLIHTNDLFILFPLEGENKSNSNLANNHHWICCPKGLFQSSLSFRSKKKKCFCTFGASLVAQTVKGLPAMWETQVWSLGREDPLEKSMATHSSILAWEIPWTEEPGRLDWVTNALAPCPLAPLLLFLWHFVVALYLV